MVIADGILVYLHNEVGPSGADIGAVAIVCGMVDEETNVVVAGLVGVGVVELKGR